MTRGPVGALAGGQSPRLGPTLALTALTTVTAVGMGRLFDGDAYLAPVLVAALGAHVLALVLRRWRVPAALGAVGGGAVILLAAVWLVVPQATWWGVPDAHTWHALHQALARAGVDFHRMRSPVPATPGFRFLAMVAVGTAGLVADSAALRLGSPVEGVLPSLAILVFTAGLGTPSHRVLLAGTWTAAALAFLLTCEVERRSSALARFAGSRPPRTALLSGGAGLSVLALAGAVLVGPALPGAGATPLVRWHNRTLQVRRTAVSPLVDIRAELLQPTTTMAFTVASPVPSYWQLTTLNHFTGSVWSEGSGPQPGVHLPAVTGPAASTVTQTYTLEGLTTTWLPAAYRPIALSGVPGATYEPGSGSILAPSAPQGLTYTVRSAIPDFTPAQLRTAKVDPTNPSLARSLTLPRSVPSSVLRLARKVVAGRTTPYGKALALQAYFRRNFTYSLKVPPSVSDNALVNFLFHTHRGYCQQFAGAYAVMARAVGLPARVAVGFTPGQRGADGQFHVRALNAHAWPEVELGQFGWVPFEPTPGRGEPGATRYTGVPPAQAGPPNAPAAPPTTTAAAPTPTPAPAPPQGSTGGGGRDHLLAHSPRPVGTAEGHPASRFPVLLAVVLGLGAVAAATLAAVPVTDRLRRRRRRARAGPGRERIVVSFLEAAEALARVGRSRHPAESFVHYARRVGPGLPAGGGPALAALAHDAEAALFAPRTQAGPVSDPDDPDDPDDPLDEARAAALAAQVRRAAQDAAPAHRRLARRADPRNLAGLGRARRRVASGPASLADTPAPRRSGGRPGLAATGAGTGRAADGGSDPRSG